MSTRATKDGPFCWLSKEALKKIRQMFDSTHDVSSGLATYVALSELASNSASETFIATHGEIAQRSGLSARTVGGVLRRLDSWGLIGTKPNFIEGATGEGRLPNSYTLLSLPKVSRNGCATPSAMAAEGFGNGRFRPPLPSNRRKVEESTEEHSEEKRDADFPERIYAAYPRKVGRPEALKAIKRAMQSQKPEFLLAQTQAFAKARPDRGDAFIPHPTTWFNQERFNDDPSTWLRSNEAARPAVKPPKPLKRIEI